MSERTFTLADEQRLHREALPGLRAGNALDERVRQLPIRERLEVWRRAGAGENLPDVVAEVEARAVG